MLSQVSYKHVTSATATKRAKFKIYAGMFDFNRIILDFFLRPRSFSVSFGQYRQCHINYAYDVTDCNCIKFKYQALKGTGSNQNKFK